MPLQTHRFGLHRVFTTRIVVTLLVLFLSGSTLLQAQLRRGVWFSPGVTTGAITCTGCSLAFSDLGGSIGLGINATPRLRVGIGSSWATTRSGNYSLTALTLDLRGRFYPGSSGFFAAGGFGFGFTREKYGGDNNIEAGAGVTLGTGWDVRLSRDLAITPFINLLMVSINNGTLYAGQVGLALTFH